MYCACFRGDVGATVLKTRPEAWKVCSLIESLGPTKTLVFVKVEKKILYIDGFNSETASIHRVFVVIVVEV